MSISIARIAMPFTFLAIVFSPVKFHLLFPCLWLFSEQANKAIFSTFSKSSMYFALLLNSQNYRICFINSRQQVHNQYMIFNMAKCVIIHIKNYIRWLKNVKQQWASLYNKNIWNWQQASQFIPQFFKFNILRNRHIFLRDGTNIPM